ncbi:MAG: hypothetical protein ACLGIV_11485 [Actinomycetes bacterium]
MTADPSDLLLQADARLLHIGPQKTGSTALQAAIQEKRGVLADHGVTAVGTDRAERAALWAALMHPGSPDQRYREDFARWDAMLAEVANAPGRVVVSNESIGKAERDGARRMVDALGGDRLHVLAVARRLDRLLPSQWQQRVKMNATTLSYERWLELVLGDHPDDPAWQNIWVPHDLQALVARWTEAAAPERFTLLVADESDRQLLSRTVEQMLGLPDGMLAPQETHRLNESLSYGRLEVARMLNERLAEVTIDPALRSRVLRTVKRYAPWPGEQRVPELPGWARERVAELSDARAGLVRSLGVRVVGDPDHLRVPPRVGDPAEEVGPALVPAELAAQAIAVAVEAAADRERQVRRLRRKVRRSAAAGDDEADRLGGRELSRQLGARLRRRLPL